MVTGDRVMTMILGLLILLVFQFLGEATSTLLGLFIPGPVLGMVYFFMALLFVPEIKRHIEGLSRFINSYLALFFVPAGVGLMEYFGLFGQHGAAMFATLIASTAITLGVTAWVFNFLLKHFSKDEPHA